MLILLLGHCGSSRGPKFDSRRALGFFPFSSLSYLSISGASGPSWRCNTADFSTYLDVKLEAKQA